MVPWTFSKGQHAKIHYLHFRRPVRSANGRFAGMVSIWSNGAPTFVRKLFQLCIAFLKLMVQVIVQRVTVHIDH